MTSNKGLASTHAFSLAVAQRAADLVLILIAWWLTLSGQMASSQATLTLVLTMISYSFATSFAPLYESQRFNTLAHQVWLVILATSMAFATLVFLQQFGLPNPEQLTTRHVMRFATVSVILLSAWRFMHRPLLVWLRKQGVNSKQACIIGCPALSAQLAKRFTENPWMGVHIAQHVDVEHREAVAAALSSAQAGQFDQVYLALPMRHTEQLRELTSALSDAACPVYLLTDLYSFDLLNSQSIMVDDLPVISLYAPPFTPIERIAKRASDILISVVALALLAPVLLTIAALVRSTSEGPALFKQTRYGVNGRPIAVFKFRSMTTQDNGDVVKQATKGDARITPLGSFLRKSSLDELPQLLNVLQGSMSIVGPRPHAVAHNEEYRQLIPGYMLRHMVKPGITGWAQINGWRGETDTLEKMEKRVEFDLDYIRRWSLWLDVKIIVLTVFKGFFSKNAY